MAFRGFWMPEYVALPCENPTSEGTSPEPDGRNKQGHLQQDKRKGATR